VIITEGDAGAIGIGMRDKERARAVKETQRACDALDRLVMSFAGHSGVNTCCCPTQRGEKETEGCPDSSTSAGALHSASISGRKCRNLILDGTHHGSVPGCRSGSRTAGQD
jgi:hypothetical protein